MSDLSSFLLDRITEDEEVARATTSSQWVANDGTSTDGLDGEWAIGTDGQWGNVVGASMMGGGVWDGRDACHIARHDPARVLAECAAKRAIVAAAVEADDIAAFPDLDGGRAWGLEQAVEMLAVVYANHADYREEWRP